MAFVIQRRHTPFSVVSVSTGTGVRRLRNQCPANIGMGVRLKSEWVSGRRRNTQFETQEPDTTCGNACIQA